MKLTNEMLDDIDRRKWWINIPKVWFSGHLASVPSFWSSLSQKAHFCLVRTSAKNSRSAESTSIAYPSAAIVAPGTWCPPPYIHSHILPSVERVGGTGGLSTTPCWSVEWAPNRRLENPRRLGTCVLCLETRTAVEPSPGDDAMPQNRKRYGWTLTVDLVSSWNSSSVSSDSESGLARASSRGTSRWLDSLIF